MTVPAVRERPLPFSPPMMRALLAGQKTQTRRIMSPQPPAWCREFGYTAFTPAGHVSGRGTYGEEGPAEKFFRSPYGVRGDRLWVREAWAMPVSLDKFNSTQIAEQCLEANYPKPWAPLRYAVDGETVNGHPVDLARDFGGAWGRPRLARFMPRWASRITLVIENVRVQRVQEISEEDAQAEGCPGDHAADRDLDAVDQYRALWDSINGKRAPWASNPWCWAITFRRVA